MKYNKQTKQLKEKQNKFKKCKTNLETPTNNLTADTKVTTIEDSGGMKITRSKKGKSNQAKSKKNPKTILTINTIKKIVKKTLRWKKGEFSDKPEFSEWYLPIPSDIKTSYEYLKIFFSDELVVYHTNLYSVQSSGRSIIVTNEDIHDFIAIEIMMGINCRHAFVP